MALRGAMLFALALVLLPRLLVPAGYMPSAVHSLTLALCGGSEVSIDLRHGEKQGPHDKAGDQACSFASGLTPLDSATPPALLVLAILFIMAHGRVSTPPFATMRRHWLWPPRTGPPLS